jgi:bile acid-coenzyme A ligase
MSELASAHPEKTAITFVPANGEPRGVSWREMDRKSIQLAHHFESRGVNEHSIVVIGLKNCIGHYLAAHAGWRLGALVLPISYRAPRAERDAILAVAKPTLVVANWGESAYPTLTSADLDLAESSPDSPLPDHIPDPGKAMCSGGGSGTPKIIVSTTALAYVPGAIEARLRPMTGFRSGQMHLIAGPLYHNAPFIWGHFGLFEDQSLVVFERFDAIGALDAIERFKINFAFLSPTMMQRILSVPDVFDRDLSSVENFFHSGAPCPEWVKHGWLKLIGPEKLWEGFGSTEDVGTVWIRGDEWLQHPGSVGKPENCEIHILDEDQQPVPAGTIGEIFARSRVWRPPPYYYIGSPPATTTADGFISVGDMGHLDGDGYLYPADRRTDLIITGGANVYPAEVEGMLSGHPLVQDVAVIGLPDAEWGKRVHAIVQAVDPDHPPSWEDLDRYARERILAYKTPKTYEFVQELARDPSGKLRRSTLVAERTTLSVSSDCVKHTQDEPQTKQASRP